MRLPTSGLPRRRPALAALLLGLALAGCQSSLGTLVQPEEEGTDGLFAELGRPAKAEGKARYRAGDFGLAERSFQTALKRDPSDGESWLGLAACYDRLGRFDLADKAYERAVGVLGRRPEVLNNLGYSYLLRGERAKARTTLLEAAAAAPDDATIKANLALLDPPPKA